MSFEELLKTIKQEINEGHSDIFIAPIKLE